MDRQRVEGRAWAMLALLGLLYILSFIDRFILALLVQPLKTDLALSDMQLGLLFGTFFALFYGLLGLPLARLADRGNRKWLVIVGVVIWSACTLGSAFAHDFATLAALRFGLAIGEAALTPAAFSMLTDAFPPRRRMLAATLFSASGMLGASLSFAIGAGVIAVAQVLGPQFDVATWRLTFAAVGLPGFVLAAAFALVAREPVRSAGEPTRSIGELVGHVMRHRRLFGGLYAGAATAQMLSYAMVAWTPALLERRFLLDVKAAGVLLGATHIVAAVGGTLIVPMILRAIAVRRPDHAGAFPAVAVAAGMVLTLVALHVPSLWLFLLLNTAGGFLVIGSINAIVVMLQMIAPGTMRATLTALLLICISSIGLGIGPPLAAALGTWRGGIGGGLVALGIGDLVLAVAALAAAARPLGSTLKDDTARTAGEKK